MKFSKLKKGQLMLKSTKFHKKNKTIYHKSAVNNTPATSPTANEVNNTENTLSFNIPEKGFNFGHLNIQGICGRDMTKFEELKCILLDQANKNLHIFGISETKLKENTMTNAFKIDGFQTPFRKDNHLNGGGWGG